jgi:HSP20 family molecular chaperone IbpA
MDFDIHRDRADKLQVNRLPSSTTGPRENGSGMARRFNDEIDRLFAELIHDPWRRGRPRAASGPAAPSGASFDIEVPVEGVAGGDLSVTIEEDQLTVTVLHHAAARSTPDTGVEVTAGRQQAFRRSFALPKGARVSGVDVAYDQDVMRVRVRLEK